MNSQFFKKFTVDCVTSHIEFTGSYTTLTCATGLDCFEVAAEMFNHCYPKSTLMMQS
jgi:hypothetical protein